MFNALAYDLEVAIAPRMAGTALQVCMRILLKLSSQVAAVVLRLPLVGPLLLSLLYHENKFYRIRK